jgi:hypothetical protein
VKELETALEELVMVLAVEEASASVRVPAVKAARAVLPKEKR